MDINEKMYDLAEEEATRKAAEVDSKSWLHDPAKVEHFTNLKNMCLANARLIYGSERMRFFDVVVSFDELKGQYGAYLVIAVNGASKLLRREVGDCPLEATRVLVQGIQKDTGLLFSKYHVGDQFYGQQGSHNAEGIFYLHGWKTARTGGPNDDVDSTDSLNVDNRNIPGAPLGPSGGVNGNKRPRPGLGPRPQLEY